MRTLFACAARFLSASDTLWRAVSGALPCGHLWHKLLYDPYLEGRAERLHIDEQLSLASGAT